MKKEGFGGGGSRGIKFIKGHVGNFPVAKPSGKTLLVTIGEGLPSNTRECKQASVFLQRMYTNLHIETTSTTQGVIYEPAY